MYFSELGITQIEVIQLLKKEQATNPGLFFQLLAEIATEQDNQEINWYWFLYYVN
jgi:hypothetical protein